MFLILLLRVKDKKRKSRYVCIVTLSREIQSIFSHHFELFRPTVHLRTLVQITLIRNISKKVILSEKRQGLKGKERKSVTTYILQGNVHHKVSKCRGRSESLPTFEN